MLMHVKVKLLVPQSCLTLCSPMDCSTQAPLSMYFSRQEYWSGCHFLLQGIFLTQGSNLGLLHCRQILYHLNHQGSLLMHVALVCLFSLLYDMSFCEYTTIYLPFDDLLGCFQFLTLIPRNRMNVLTQSTLYKSSTSEHLWEFL